jgi:hypothetical protein
MGGSAEPMKYIFIILLVIVSTMLVACTDKTINVSVDDSSNTAKYYSIVSSGAFNESLCESLGYSYSENGSDTGLRIALKDKDTNKTIDGSATYTFARSGGSLSIGGNYTCEKSVNEDTELISVYSQGYSPLVFTMPTPKNSLLTIEVEMMKSCTGAPSCFDNFEVQHSKLKFENRTRYDELLDEQKNIFYNYVDNSLGVNRTDYVLQCMECNLGRGGYVKAKGIYLNGSDFELYYHWGWCSSGGGDCGYDVCVSTTSPNIFSSAKNIYCNKLYWNERSDGHICLGETFNNDTIIKDECNQGQFENVSENRKTIALKQASNRCGSSVTAGNYDCLNN